MKGQAVIKALPYQLFKILAGNRCNFRIEFNLNFLSVFHFDNYHGNTPFLFVNLIRICPDHPAKIRVQAPLS